MEGPLADVPRLFRAQLAGGISVQFGVETGRRSVLIATEGEGAGARSRQGGNKSGSAVRLGPHVIPNPGHG